MARSPLLSRLWTADRAWRRSQAGEALLRSVKWLVLGVALVVAADLIAQLGGTVRFILSVTGGLIVLGWLIWLAVRGFGPGRSLMRIARHLEGRDPALGSKLVNILQLEDQANDKQRPALTRTLARRAVDEASQAVDGCQFLPLTKSPTLRRTAWRAFIPVAVLAVPAICFGPIAGREIMRFLDPFGDHPAFSLTRLRIVTPDRDGVGVVYKQPAVVEVEWSGHRPGELFLGVVDEADPSRELRLPMAPAGERRFVQQIDQVTGDLVVRARTRTGRSASEGRRIRAILTPQLERATVRIVPPAYTRRPAHESVVPLGAATAPGLTALVGSRIDFTLASNRPLSAGRLLVHTTAPDADELPLLPGAGENEHLAEAGLTASESGRLRFDLRDTGGLPADKELVANLTVTHDLPPDIAITEPAQDGFIVDTFAATVALRAGDDYGLKTIRWHLGVNGTYAEPQVRPMQEDPPQRTAVETIRLAPAELGARAGDVLTIFADATDIRPASQIARSQTLTLEVISEEEYNEYLRVRTEIGDLESKYTKLHEALRALAQEQRDLAAAAAKLDDPTEAQRDELKARQDTLNERLEALAKQMSTATRDQPLYDLEKDLQKVLDTEAAAIRDSVAANKQALAAFAQAPPTGAGTQSFANEAHAQADRLDPAAAAAEKQIAEALEDAQLMQELLKSLAAFQAAYEAQRQLASQTEPFKVGDKPLSDEDRLSLQQMSAAQRQVGEILKAVASNLRRDADRAESVYPEAAGDARDIADAIEEANLSALTDASARAMLAARGVESHDRAEQVRSEMEKLMGQCGQCQGGMGGEFAQRLKLVRSMLAGQTFSQMAQCRKFGFGSPHAAGMGGAGGAGMFGMGFAQDGTPQRSLLGGESQLGRSQGRESASRSDASAQGLKSPGADIADGADPNSRSGPVTMDRPSTSATGDAVLDEYRDVVDAYFRKLTTSRPTRQ